jgi:hypothetical protein
MLSDGLTAKQAEGTAREEVEVLDVAQLLLAAVKAAPAPAEPAAPTAPSPADHSTEEVSRPADVGAGAGVTETGETATAPRPARETEPPDAASTDVDALDRGPEPGDDGADRR